MNNEIVGAVDVKYLDMLPKPVLNDEFFSVDITVQYLGCDKSSWNEYSIITAITQIHASALIAFILERNSHLLTFMVQLI